MEPIFGDGLGSFPHHVERRGDQDEFFDGEGLLRDQPGDPAAK